MGRCSVAGMTAVIPSKTAVEGLTLFSSVLTREVQRPRPEGDSRRKAPAKPDAHMSSKPEGN